MTDLRQFARDTQPPPDDIARAEATLGPLLGRRPRSRRSIALPMSAVAVAVAVAALASVSLWGASEPVPLDIPLASSGQLEPIPGLVLDYEGQGAVVGTSARAEVLWEAGTLRVQLEPGAHTELSIQTEEAQVEVVGTVFEVHRDLAGTRVTVERGRVLLTCTDQPPGELGAAEEGRCWPLRASAFLGLARTWQDEGRSAEDILEVAEAGLGRATPESRLQGELQVVRIHCLMDLDRDADALEAAQRYLEDPQAVRRTQILALVERLREASDQNSPPPPQGGGGPR